MVRLVFLILLLLNSFLGLAQPTKWQLQESVTTAHLRGLHMVSEDVIWASGTGGTFLRTLDGGRSWLVDTIQGATHLDFRDIHAFGGRSAIVLSAGNDARIYKTSDGGKSWNLVYSNQDEGVFFDGFDFYMGSYGVAYSDPIDGEWLVILSTDAGDTWEETNGKLPKPEQGEAGFAASGTGVVLNEMNIWIASGGGSTANVYYSNNYGHEWEVYKTPLTSGEDAGIFSMAFGDNKIGVIVGGSYIDSTNKDANCAYTSDGGKSWILLKKDQPNGYRSCVSTNGTVWLTVGRTGSDYSTDNGKTWAPINEEGFFSCVVGRSTAWAVGRNGKIGSLKIADLTDFAEDH